MRCGKNLPAEAFIPFRAKNIFYSFNVFFEKWGGKSVMCYIFLTLPNK